MENKKDIGKAFKEKLDELQKSPSNAVWNSISKQLVETKNDKQPKIWWKKAGYVLGITLVATLSYVLWQEIQPETTEISTPASQTSNETANNRDNHGDVKTINRADGDKINTIDKESITQGISTGTLTGSKSKAEKNNTSSKIITSPVIANSKTHNKRKNTKQENRNAIAYGTSSDTGNNKLSGSGKRTDPVKNTKNIRPATTTVVRDNTGHEKTSMTETKVAAKSIDSLENKTGGTGAAVSAENARNPQQHHKEGNNFKNSSVINATGTKANPGSQAIKNIQQQDSITKSARADNYTDKNRLSEKNNSESNSINDRFIENNLVTDGNVTNSPPSSSPGSSTVVSDSIPKEGAITETAKDSLEELSKKDNIYKKFYIYPHITLSYNGIQPTSLLIDQRLEGIETNSKITFAFGAYLGYNLNNKWGLRTGITYKTIELTPYKIQGTHIVHLPTEYGPSIIYPDNFTNIKYKQGITNESIIHTLIDAESQNADITLITKFAFLELPLEAVYNVVGDKLGLWASGGFCALIVTENSVYAKNANGSVHMGSLKYVDNLSLSANLGIGFYYKFLPQLQLNLEPMARYYLNSQILKQSYSIQAGLQYNFDIWDKKE